MLLVLRYTMELIDLKRLVCSSFSTKDVNLSALIVDQFISVKELHHMQMTLLNRADRRFVYFSSTKTSDGWKMFYTSIPYVHFYR